MHRFKKAALYLVFAAVVFSAQFLRTGDLVTGKPPAITQATLGGIHADAILGQGPALLYFWGEWCGICAVMQTSVSAIAGDYPLLTVAMRSGTDGAVAHYLKQKNLAWPVINDTRGNIAQTFGVSAVPTFFFIGAKGDIVFTSVGYSTEWGLRLRLWLAGLL